MSNDKEFKWIDSECFKYDQFQAFYDHEFDFKMKNQKNQNRQSFESAWKYQQEIIDAKDEEIEKRMIKIGDMATEFNAYAILQKDIIEQKNKEIERYKKALEFYSSFSAQYCDDFSTPNVLCSDGIIQDDYEFDRDYKRFGKRARQALGGESDA